MIESKIPVAFQELFLPARYKGYHGGRGSAKSWSFAEALGIIGYQKPTRVLCVREYQNSIADSVHKLVSDRIYDIGLGLYYNITDKAIRGDNGTEFIFKGIKQSPREIKSVEGVDICWYEEAQLAGKDSLEILRPSIRKPGSELWFSWNPEDADTPIEKLLRGDTKAPRSIVREVSWRDNPYFTPELEEERQHDLRIDPVAYEHIWEGQYRRISDALVFKNRVFVEGFDTPADARFFHGADWGFSNDPTVLVRAFVLNDCLYIDQEAFGYGVEIDETPALFDSIPTSRRWPIKADSARPETISYVKRKGFNVTPADKWKGSVEDGVAHLKGFTRIVVHPRCKRTAQEFRLYSYKVDKRQLDENDQPLVLPIIVDAHNHAIDALRYALDGYIQKRGVDAVWSKLVGK